MQCIAINILILDWNSLGMKIVLLEMWSSARTPFITSLGPNKRIAASTFSCQVIVPQSKLADYMLQYVCYYQYLQTAQMKWKQKRREEYAVRFIEIDFLLPDIGMKLKMCLREIPNLASYTLMNDESCSTLCMIKIKKWRPLRFAHRWIKKKY